MTRLRYTSAQFANTCQHLTERSADLPAIERSIRARATLDRADGYPTNSGFDRGAPTNDCDEDGVPLPPRSDPVGRLVTDREEHDTELETALATAWTALQTALRSVEEVHAAFDSTQPPVKPDEERTPADDIWCTSCMRVQVFTPRAGGRGTLCGWCYGWKMAHEHGTDGPALPWPELIERRARGERITSRVVAEVERARRDTGSKKTKRKNRRK